MLVMMTPSPASSERTRVKYSSFPDNFKTIFVAEGPASRENPAGPAVAAVSLPLLPG